MPQKRMFSLQIVDTDAFLEMPISSQLLYFHLTMRADDEGFVGSPKKIMRLIGVQDDDLKILIAKRFILIFESGIIVIKHWLIHNTIRMDRFNQTSYQDEKKFIGVKKNNSYTEIKKTGIEVKQIEERERPEWQKRRDLAYKKSDLPNSFSYKIRQAFQEKECPICSVKMQGYEFSDNKRPTIQHNKPISLGGKHKIDNISVICRECNVSIQDRETTGKLNNSEVIEVWNTLGNHSATQVKLSKVNLSKDNINTAEPSSAGVKQIMDVFYKTNPTLNWGNKNTRKSCEDLINLMGIEKAVEISEFAISVQGKPYAPVITTPYQLKEKLAQLKIYHDREKGGGSINLDNL